MIKVLMCFGTRPEVIKLAPMVHAMQSTNNIVPVLCSTGQHQSMVSQMLDLFDLHLDEDLAIMQKDQTVESVTISIMSNLAKVLDRVRPEYVMVQGDTTSAFTAGLVAYYNHIPVLHLEAGLRSGDMSKPWPEEANRRLLSVLAALHLAPTQFDADNLVQENIAPNNVHVVGNTVVDAMQYVQNKTKKSHALLSKLENKFFFLGKNEKFILVTGHRRESHNGGHAEVFKVLKKIAEKSSIKIVFPVHLNPLVKDLANDILSECSNVYLQDPVDYIEMQYLLQKCYFVITDSGGIQEEAPSYGKPLLITREVTERTAGVINGSAVLVGTNPTKLFNHAMQLISDEGYYAKMSKSGNPYGDGKAAQRVCEIITKIYHSEEKKVETIND